jgi:hypothetical protein
MASADSALSRLADELAKEAGLPEGVVAAPVDGASARLGAVAAAGPRAAGREIDYELLIETIREGHELHYGRPRVVRTEDRDLALLAGDRLYALGLERLARLGDLVATAELADVISLCAQAQAAGQPELAEAVWEAGVTAVGWGASPEHERAKAAARRLDPDAVAALHAAARHATGDLAHGR